MDLDKLLVSNEVVCRRAYQRALGRGLASPVVVMTVNDPHDLARLHDIPLSEAQRIIAANPDQELLAFIGLERDDANQHVTPRMTPDQLAYLTGQPGRFAAIGLYAGNPTIGVQLFAIDGDSEVKPGGNRLIVET
jgi:hypothetical protein